MQDFTAFDLDQYVAGKSKTWTFWNCEPSTFPWDYAAVEHAYILQGKFSVQYEGADPVTLVAGDFVSAELPCGVLLLESQMCTVLREYADLKLLCTCAGNSGSISSSNNCIHCLLT